MKRIAGEVELPEEIIQRIQSFLTQEEAAQTSLVSKLWCSAWSTRPNLDFDQYRFLGSRDEMQMFSRFTRKSMQRYEDLNLKVETLRLRMSSDSRFEHPNLNVSLATELLARVLKLGVVALHLDFNLYVPRSYTCYVLSHEHELFKSQTLTRFSAASLISIDLRLTNSYYSNLKSLHLDRVTVKGDLYRDLISRFPLLEDLKLNSLKISFSQQMRRRDGHEFEKLKYLWVGEFPFSRTFSRATFRCLKELVINDYGPTGRGGGPGYPINTIRSSSLELINISLQNGRIWHTEFDVPNIRRFEFEGCVSSRFRFKSTKTTWESLIRVQGPGRFSSAASWFNKLVKLLNTNPSKLSLHIHVDDLINRDDRLRLSYDTPKTPLALENLILDGDPPYFSAFLDILLLICRPKLLTIMIEPCPRDYMNQYLHKILAEGLVQQVIFARDLRY